jgi:predicted dinucleotide-binding enzyme
MRIAMVGRGNVGGGLADLWQAAGRQLMRFGRGGGDVSDAEFVRSKTSRPTGYDPVHTGPLTNAAAQEALLSVIFAISEAIDPYAYRFAPLESL